jgi:hypothetical protein
MEMVKRSDDTKGFLVLPRSWVVIIGGSRSVELPREMITLAERRFPVRIRIAVPPNALGQRHSQITPWLDANRGADGWAMTPSGTRVVLNDALSTLASAFRARCCIRAKAEGSHRNPVARASSALRIGNGFGMASVPGVWIGQPTIGTKPSGLDSWRMQRGSPIYTIRSAPWRTTMTRSLRI